MNFIDLEFSSGAPALICLVQYFRSIFSFSFSVFFTSAVYTIYLELLDETKEAKAVFGPVHCQVTFI